MMDIINLQVLREVPIQHFINHVLILSRKDKLSFFVFLSQVNASDRIRIALQKFTKMSFCCQTLYIHRSM